MEKLFNFLELKMETPTSYGWLHLLFIAIVIAVTALLCVYFKDCSDKTFRRIAFISWILIVVLECYKQIVYTYSFEDGALVADYQWYAFPYQLCSTPLYVLPFVAFMKDGKVRDFFTSYISTFAFFGGFVVFIYPNDIFVSTIGINLQSLIHHGLQIVFGIYFAVYFRKRLNLKYFLKSIPVFAGLLIIAVVLNETAGLHIYKTLGEDFSMFYVSSFIPTHLPILSNIYTAVPWIIFLLIYTFGFCLASFIVYYGIVGGIILTTKIKNNFCRKENINVDQE